MVTFDFAKAPITKIVDAIIAESSKVGASDIHFDPRDDGLIVRRRIDGELVDYTFIPKVYERNLTTRLKLMSGMNITESRLPQDGAIKGKFGQKDLDMRVSSLPTNEGEKVVIRILDYSRSLSGIEKLGFNKENFVKLNNMISVPNGIILITGATGSGKSTTSYSILQVLNKEKTNIITVEDPIEMNIEGLNQVQVNSEIGLDFATVLRSILRQDPNIILIGEIRDSETAKIAVRASITGHLVISTLHTNNSLATIERLLDMDVERYLLSTALTGIISQRLAKTVCQHCKVVRPTTPYEKKVFKLALKKDVDQIIDANHSGCKFCNKGYRGRIAIQEVLEIDDEIRSVLNNEKVEKEELKKLVYGSGNVITLLQDGLLKILNGFTTFEEIYRIIEIDNDINDSCYEELSEDLTFEERIELDKRRSYELSELKRKENIVGSKISVNTQSIIPSNNENKVASNTIANEQTNINDSIPITQASNGKIAEQVEAPQQANNNEVTKQVTTPQQANNNEVTKQVATPQQINNKEVTKQVATPQQINNKEVTKQVVTPQQTNNKDVTKQVATPQQANNKDVTKQVVIPQQKYDVKSPLQPAPNINNNSITNILPPLTKPQISSDVKPST